MKFSEAMKLLEEGKKVRNKNWGNKDYYLCKDNGYLVDNFGDEPVLIVDGEWEEYIEEGKIEEILDALMPEDERTRENFRIAFSKLNEVIRYINSKE